MALFNLGGKRNDEMRSVVNSAKTLLANIRFMDVDNPIRTIAITSAVPNEGKTFVAANLASAIATSGKTVLLVEADMRRRSMSRVLGTHAQNGIYSVMAGEVDLRRAAVSTPTPNLYFLDAEPRIPNPSDLLNSHRFSRLVEQASSLFDYVLFDTPPVGTFIDAAVLGTKVDAVFMVVREGFTRKAEIASASEQLKKSGCNLAGVVMNYCERRSNEYYYEYYYSRDDSGSANDGPELPQTASRRSSSTSSSVPSRPSRRRSAPETPATSNETVEDDTGVYERLAEQVARAQSARSTEDLAREDGGRQFAAPVIPQRSEDEY